MVYGIWEEIMLIGRGWDPGIKWAILTIPYIRTIITWDYEKNRIENGSCKYEVSTKCL